MAQRAIIDTPHDGVPVRLSDGATYLVPPLTLGKLQALQGRLLALDRLEAMSMETVSTVVEVTYLALVRNYPAITREEVAELIDVGNMGDVFAAVIDVCGMKRRAQQAAAGGEPGNPAAPAVG